VETRSLEASVRRYARNSTLAFLEGAKDTRWITGVLLRSGMSKQDTLRELVPLRNYGDPLRGQSLFTWLDSTDW
jgi:hypothetical protein